jgi:flagellar assembly protein FliH
LSSRILSAEAAAGARTWDAPLVEQAGPALHGGGTTGGVVRASTLEDLQREAYDEAFRQGYRDGQAAAQEEVVEEVRRFASLIDSLARPFENLDSAVEEELLQLSLALAKQVVRRELRQDPTQIIAIVREAIAALPVSAREVRVHLHPEDAAIVRQHLAPTERERAWVVVEDPVMMRGGCQVLTPTSRVDARLETRLGKVLSDLLGGQRQLDGRDPDPA